MTHPVPPAAPAAGPGRGSSTGTDRDRFRAAVVALPPGPLREVLTAVAYARDAAARTGEPAVPDDRWQAVVAVAERVLRPEVTELAAARRRRSARADRDRTTGHLRAGTGAHSRAVEGGLRCGAP